MRFACHIHFSGGGPLELAQGPSRVAPTLHLVGRSTRFGVTAERKPISTRGAQRTDPRYLDRGTPAVSHILFPLSSTVLSETCTAERLPNQDFPTCGNLNQFGFTRAMCPPSAFLQNRNLASRTKLARILAEGAIALSVTLSGGALFAS